MTFAIDFVGTNLESGTKTYNINFCNELNLINHDQKIEIFGDGKQTRDFTYVKDVVNGLI